MSLASFLLCLHIDLLQKYIWTGKMAQKDNFILTLGKQVLIWIDKFLFKKYSFVWKKKYKTLEHPLKNYTCNKLSWFLDFFPPLFIFFYYLFFFLCQISQLCCEMSLKWNNKKKKLKKKWKKKIDFNSLKPSGKISGFFKESIEQEWNLERFESPLNLLNCLWTLSANVSSTIGRRISFFTISEAMSKMLPSEISFCKFCFSLSDFTNDISSRSVSAFI